MIRKIKKGDCEKKFGIYSFIPAQAGDKRRLRSSYFSTFWIPAYAGMTSEVTFYESVIVNVTK